MTRPPMPARRPARPSRRRRASRSWRELIVTVPPDAPEALSPLRHLATVNLIAWGVGRQRVGEIVLCLSELVANALLHTCGPARVLLVVRAGSVVLEVADRGGNAPAQSSEASAGAGEHGRGLHIVRALALTVEVRSGSGGHGKSVVACFPVA